MKNNLKINILGHEWAIEFLDKDSPELGGAGADGRTYYNELKIVIRNDLNPQITRSVLTHELTHAVLMCQGRWMQKKFDQEELCEFMGFCGKLIVSAVDAILEATNSSDVAKFLKERGL